MPITKIFAKPAFFITSVYKWQTIKPEGWNRVRDKVNGTSYLLNCNRLDGIQDKSVAPLTWSSFYFFDNPFDNRCSSGYVVCNDSVADIKAHMDVEPAHQFISLNIFPELDHTQAAVATTIPIENFAFAVAVTDSHAATQSYVYYVDSGWKFKMCRVDHTLLQILALTV
jgi:hypothetical protein